MISMSYLFIDLSELSDNPGRRVLNKFYDFSFEFAIWQLRLNGLKGFGNIKAFHKKKKKRYCKYR